MPKAKAKTRKTSDGEKGAKGLDDTSPGFPSPFAHVFVLLGMLFTVTRWKLLHVSPVGRPPSGQNAQEAQAKAGCPTSGQNAQEAQTNVFVGQKDCVQKVFAQRHMFGSSFLGFAVAFLQFQTAISHRPAASVAGCLYLQPAAQQGLLCFLSPRAGTTFSLTTQDSFWCFGSPRASSIMPNSHSRHHRDARRHRDPEERQSRPEKLQQRGLVAGDWLCKSCGQVTYVHRGERPDCHYRKCKAACPFAQRDFWNADNTPNGIPATFDLYKSWGAYKSPGQFENGLNVWEWLDDDAAFQRLYPTMTWHLESWDRIKNIGWLIISMVRHGGYTCQQLPPIQADGSVTVAWFLTSQEAQDLRITPEDLKELARRQRVASSGPDGDPKEDRIDFQHNEASVSYTHLTLPTTPYV